MVRGIPELKPITPPRKDCPLVLDKGDGEYQAGELPENTLIWTHDTRPSLYGHWLAWQITIEHSVDPAEKVELVELMDPSMVFKGDVSIKGKNQALKEAGKIERV